MCILSLRDGKKTPTRNTTVLADDCVYFAYTLCQCAPELLHHFFRATAFAMIGSCLNTVRIFVCERERATYPD